MERTVAQRGGFQLPRVRERMEVIAGHAVQRAWRERAQGTQFPLTARHGVAATAFAEPSTSTGAASPRSPMHPGARPSGFQERSAQGTQQEGLDMMGPAPWESLEGDDDTEGGASSSAAAGGARSLQVISHEDSAFARLRASYGLRGIDLA